MTYIERLLSRALAVPRQADVGLFDPFEQIADWPLATPPGMPDPATAMAAAAPASSRSPLDKQAARRGPVDSNADQATTPITAPLPGRMETSAPTEAMAPPADPDIPDLRPRAVPAAAPSRDTTADALRKADSFLQALAPAMVPPVATTGDPAARTAEPRNIAPPPATPPALSMMSQPSGQAPAFPTRSSAPIVPTPPPVSVMAPSTMVHKRSGTAPATPDAVTVATPRKASTQRLSASTPATPAPERTIIVGRDARGRPELAHSLNIIRFGLGQE